MNRILVALACLVVALPVSAQQVVASSADGDGVCTITGTLLPGDDAAVRCVLDHDEQTPLSATIETGSLDVQAWLLRATGHDVLVGLHNTGGQAVDLLAARITVGRMVRATRRGYPRGYPPFEKCMAKTIAERGDVAACDVWK